MRYLQQIKWQGFSKKESKVAIINGSGLSKGPGMEY